MSEERAETAQARANAYALLAAVFMSEPRRELIEALRSEQMKQAMDQMGVRLGSRFYTMSEHRLLETLAVEYTRLFLGPGPHLSPHESVQVQGDTGLHWGESTVRVEREMTELGLQLPPDWRGVPDHLGVELEVMRSLTQREAGAWSRDPAEAESLVERQRRFLAEHLLRWAPDFCEKVSLATRQPFYRAMARLTRSYLLDEWEALSAPEGSDVPLQG
ncbi:MAG: molecular chaperone TorD family protein [Chloroflexi bacterium]|nr:molecular chaperone TorD family protein [Chloroflexota bacterium]